MTPLCFTLSFTIMTILIGQSLSVQYLHIPMYWIKRCVTSLFPLTLAVCLCLSPLRFFFTVYLTLHYSLPLCLSSSHPVFFCDIHTFVFAERRYVCSDMYEANQKQLSTRVTFYIRSNQDGSAQSCHSSDIP